MKYFVKIMLIVSTLMALVSCSRDRSDDNQMEKQETPEALQDGSLEIKSYSRSSDLIEELYQELVNKSPELKKLEDDLADFKPKPNELSDKFNSYDGKSNSYYNAANNKVSLLKDSLLHLRIRELIKKSNDEYSAKTAELNSLLQQISKNKSTLSDHYSVLKIVLTLPLIEKYQDDNKLAKKEFKELINQQENLILRTDSLTPKY